MAIKVKEDGVTYWIDSTGLKVPTKHVDKQAKKRDRAARKVFKKAKKLHDRMVKTKQQVVDIIEDYLDILSEEYGEDWKGNAEIKDFSDTVKINVMIDERIEFDERLQLAKQKIDSCLKKWTKDGRSEIKAIIDRAFQVDKKGKVNQKRILQLRTLDIEDEEWNEAMDLINDSYRVVNTKRYINIYFKPDQDQEASYVSLPLNWSKV